MQPTGLGDFLGEFLTVIGILVPEASWSHSHAPPYQSAVARASTEKYAAT